MSDSGDFDTDENGNNYGSDNDKQELYKLDEVDEVDWRRRQFPRANMLYPRIKTVFEREMPKKCEEVYMCLALLKANERSLDALLQAEAKQVGIIYINYGYFVNPRISRRLTISTL